MIISNAFVRWNLAWDQPAEIALLVDAFPPKSKLIYTQRGNCYFALAEGYVSFYHWKGPGNERGFGGSTIRIRVKDPIRTVELKGPWSSRSSVMNTIFTPSIEASYSTAGERTSEYDQRRFQEGHTSMSGHASVKLIEVVLKQGFPHLELIATPVENSLPGELRYLVHHQDRRSCLCYIHRKGKISQTSREIPQFWTSLTPIDSSKI